MVLLKLLYCLPVTLKEENYFSHLMQVPQLFSLQTSSAFGTPEILRASGCPDNLELIFTSSWNRFKMLSYIFIS